MKTVYLARHAESHLNTGPVRADDSALLTDAGIKEAHALAKRCAKLPLESIIAGTTVRARETARIIAKECDIAFEESELFRERRKPSVLYGMKKSDPEAHRIDKSVRDNFHVDGYRFSDEENFDDLKARAKAALALIDARPEEHLLIVTHGIVLRILIAYVIMGDALTGAECDRFWRTLRMDTSGLCVLKHTSYTTEEGGASPWQLWGWNDIAHLG